MLLDSKAPQRCRRYQVAAPFPLRHAGHDTWEIPDFPVQRPLVNTKVTRQHNVSVHFQEYTVPKITPFDTGNYLYHYLVCDF